MKARNTSAFTHVIRVQGWIVMLGVVLLLLKFGAYFITHSVAVLTDALESIVNVVAGVITWFSLRVAGKPRDQGHPYGHGKAEYISAGIEGTLISLAGVLILAESIRKLLQPQPIHALQSGVLLIGLSGVVNALAGWWAISIGKKNGSVAIIASGRHLLSDAISTAGLVAGLLLLWLTGWQWLDSAIALLFGGVIIVTGIKIVKQSIAGIMDEADTSLLEQLVELMNRSRPPEWIDLHNVRLIKFGNRLHVDCHLTLPWYLNLKEAHEQIDSFASLVRDEMGDGIEFFIHTDACMPFSCKICSVKDCSHRQHPFEQHITWTIENIFENEKHEHH
jgi:cation diffusion facilitator family transporter